MNNMHLDQIAGMLDQAADRISEFKKETYAISFERHLEENISVWSALAAVWNEDTPDREQVYNGEAVACNCPHTTNALAVTPALRDGGLFAATECLRYCLP